MKTPYLFLILFVIVAVFNVCGLITWGFDIPICGVLRVIMAGMACYYAGDAWKRARAI